MEEKVKEKTEKSRCAHCGSTQIYYRLKTKDKYCRICGYVEDLIKKETKKE